ncbi:MAG: aspartate aminotransferase family protein [Proteobacteria bacterium]|nr:aspartate aminotransferase family protein [Pseudomonadota bacterium]
MAASFLDMQSSDAAHHLHPFSDNGKLAEQGTRIISQAKGVYITDAEGRRLLDGMAGLWCVNIGYGREELIDAATAQLRELPYYNSFFQCTTPPAIELAELIGEIAPAHMNHVFFTGSGSEANDTVIRMVRHYWATLGHENKNIIISRHNAYHGSTVAGASLSGMKPMHAQGGLPIPNIVHIDQPYWFAEGRDEDPQEFGLRIARELDSKIRELGVDRVAAFIAEPVQGAGGVIVPPESYWPEIQRICDVHGILLISDEVICGFGRMGQWFGADYYGTTPDLMPVAKGLSSGYLPIGGVVVSDRVADVLKSKGGEFHHGFTYSGHPVCAAVAVANLRILREEKIIEYVRDEIGPYLQSEWRKLGDHPLVGEARGVGMMAALELVASKDPLRSFEDAAAVGDIARDLAIENGLVMRSVGSKLIISPPLVITKTEVDELITKASATLDAVATSQL